MGSTKRALAKVSLGLNLIYTGLVLVVLGIFAGIGVGIATKDPKMTVLITAGIVLIGTVLDVVGRFLCLAVPEKARATSLIYSSVACTLIGLILNWVGTYQANQVLTSISSLFSLAGAVIFMVFLMRFATFLNRTDLADKGVTILTGSVIVVVVLIGLVFGMATQAVPPAVGGIGMLVAIIALLVLFVKYANLIAALRDASGSYTRNSSMY